MHIRCADVCGLFRPVTSSGSTLESAGLGLKSANACPFQATIGIDFLSKTLYLEDRTVRLQLW